MANNKPVGPGLWDPMMWVKAGIDIKTGKPDRLANWDAKLKNDMKILWRIKDEQDAVNRYNWFNIPCPLSSQEIERRLYYNHSLIFFYMKDIDQYLILPYAYDGGLDLWGRPQYVHPVPYASGTSDEEKKNFAIQEAYLRNIKLKVIYDVQLEEDYLDDNGELDLKKATDLLENSCVILRDYTCQFSENGIPRYQLQDSLLDVMADCTPFSRTALLNSTGVLGIGVDSDDEAAAVYGFSNTVNNAALAGKKYLPIKKQLGKDLQELTGNTVANAEEFLQALQGYNNLRLSFYGLDNNGLYDKKAYVNNLQSGVSNVGLSLQDGITNRQNACNIINSIWGIMIWCDISEVVSGMDQNLDGMTYDEQDQSGQVNNTPAGTVNTTEEGQ